MQETLRFMTKLDRAILQEEQHDDVGMVFAVRLAPGNGGSLARGQDQQRAQRQLSDLFHRENPLLVRVGAQTLAQGGPQWEP